MPKSGRGGKRAGGGAAEMAERINAKVDQQNANAARQVASTSVFNKMSPSGRQGLLDAAGVGSTIKVEAGAIGAGILPAQYTLEKKSSGKWEIKTGPVNDLMVFDQRMVKSRDIAYLSGALDMKFK